MPTLRTIRKGSTAGGVSSEDTDTDIRPTAATANNKTIDLLDGDKDEDDCPPPLARRDGCESDSDDDEEDVEVIEIVRPAQKHSSNK